MDYRYSWHQRHASAGLSSREREEYQRERQGRQTRLPDENHAPNPYTSAWQRRHAARAEYRLQHRISALSHDGDSLSDCNRRHQRQVPPEYNRVAPRRIPLRRAQGHDDPNLVPLGRHRNSGAREQSQPVRSREIDSYVPTYQDRYSPRYNGTRRSASPTGRYDRESPGPRRSNLFYEEYQEGLVQGQDQWYEPSESQSPTLQPYSHNQIYTNDRDSPPIPTRQSPVPGDIQPQETVEPLLMSMTPWRSACRPARTEERSEERAVRPSFSPLSQHHNEDLAELESLRAKLARIEEEKEQLVYEKEERENEKWDYEDEKEQWEKEKEELEQGRQALRHANGKLEKEKKELNKENNELIKKMNKLEKEINGLKRRAGVREERRSSNDT